MNVKIQGRKMVFQKAEVLMIPNFTLLLTHNRKSTVILDGWDLWRLMLTVMIFDINILLTNKSSTIT